MLAQLGNYIFNGLEAPGSMSSSSAAKYGKIALINKKDVLQKIGDELDEINFSLQLSVDFCNPATLIDELRKSMGNGEILPLIMGNGTIMGKYVLTDVNVIHRNLFPDGSIGAAQVEISLLQFSGGEDVEVTGTALKKSNPIPQIPDTPVETPAASITEDIKEAKNNVNRIKQIASSAKGSIDTFKRRVREVTTLAENTQRLYTSAKTKVTATKKIISRAGNLPTSLDEAIKYAENVAKLSNVTDFSSIESNISELSDSADKVGISAAPVVSFLATKEGGS